MKKVIYVLVTVASLLGLSGCSSHETSNNTSNTVVSNEDAPDYVIFNSPMNNVRYVLTNERVSKVGNVIFNLQSSDTMSQGPSWSTNDTSAEKLYQIPGANMNNAVAVELKDGTYVKANAVVTEWVSDTYGPNTNYYAVSTKKISNVGKMLYDFYGKNSVNYAPSYWGTNDTDAVKVYHIPGVDDSKAVAVKLADGAYVEANTLGNKEPSL